MAKVKKIKKFFRSWLPIILTSIFFLLVFVSFFLPKDQFQKAKEKLVKNPNDTKQQLILAEEFLKNNQFKEAEKALLMTPQNDKNTELLWQTKHNSDPQDVRQLIAAWEKILAEKPNYRDGWLQLTVLYYKLYQNDKAKASLQKAIQIDPNYAPTKELEKILGS